MALQALISFWALRALPVRVRSMEGLGVAVFKTVGRQCLVFDADAELREYGHRSHLLRR